MVVLWLRGGAIMGARFHDGVQIWLHLEGNWLVQRGRNVGAGVWTGVSVGSAVGPLWVQDCMMVCGRGCVCWLVYSVGVR